MIRRNFTIIVCLTLIFSYNFYLLFENLNSSVPHFENHFLHQFIAGFLSCLFLLVYFKDRVFTGGKVNQSKILAVVFLFIFTFIYLAPAKLNFTFHHQSESGLQTQHPCCMPQVATAATFIQIEPVLAEYARFKEISELEVFLPFKNIHNKSPPLS